MKTKDAQAILGADNVYMLFLQENSQAISRFVRSLISQANFYYIDHKKIAEFMKKEVLWQSDVEKAYREHLCHHRQSISSEIEHANEENLF